MKHNISFFEHSTQFEDKSKQINWEIRSIDFFNCNFRVHRFIPVSFVNVFSVWNVLLIFNFKLKLLLNMLKKHFESFDIVSIRFSIAYTWFEQVVGCRIRKNLLCMKSNHEIHNRWNTILKWQWLSYWINSRNESIINMDFIYRQSLFHFINSLTTLKKIHCLCNQSHDEHKFLTKLFFHI